MKTIEQQWDRFSSVAFRGLDISDTQSTEMKKAFFAGATAMFALVQATGDPEVSEDKAVAHLDALQDEAVAFMRSLIEVEGL